MLIVVTQLADGTYSTNVELPAARKAYRRSPAVLVRQMPDDFVIKGPEEDQYGKPGDYLCESPTGEPFLVRQETFERLYCWWDSSIFGKVQSTDPLPFHNDP